MAWNGNSERRDARGGGAGATRAVRLSLRECWGVEAVYGPRRDADGDADSLRRLLGSLLARRLAGEIEPGRGGK